MNTVTTSPKIRDLPPFPGTPRRAEHAELLAAFLRVAPEHDWRDSILTSIRIKNGYEEKLIQEAVVYFTGSVASFTPRPGDIMRVQAKGYYRTKEI